MLAGARAVVAVNTGPAHLAAAVGTPVVSLFAPVVAASAWAPYGVPVVVLGDQYAACVGTRARTCPVPGHPCLTGDHAGRRRRGRRDGWPPRRRSQASVEDGGAGMRRTGPLVVVGDSCWTST